MKKMLNPHKTLNILMMVESSREYGRGIISGVARYSRLHGPWTVYSEPSGEDRAWPQLNNVRPDGIIARETPMSMKQLDPQIPTILLVTTKINPQYLNIIMDDERIGKLAANYYIGLGFKSFGFCGINQSHEREFFFREVIENSGFKVSTYQPQYPKMPELHDEIELLASWLVSLPRPTAILALNDERARHIIEACRYAEIALPDEIAILGVDNDEIVCNLSNPTLSSIKMNTEKAGFEAAHLLDHLIHGEEEIAHNNIIVEPVDVIERESTNILAIEDIVLRNAISFIRNNCMQPITVQDIAEASCVSKRTLERKFKKEFTFTVSKELRKARINQVSKLLLNSEESISHIANHFYFTDFKHLSHVFKKEKGMSPSNYRKKFSKFKV